MRLAEALGVPVFASWRRPDAFPNTHPLFLGMCGLSAAPTVLPRLVEADVLLVIGSRLSEMTTFGYRVPSEETRWVHVDLEPGEAEASRPAPSIALASDAGRFIDAALGLLRGAAIDAEGRSARLRATSADRDAYLAATTTDTETPWDGPGVHPGRVVATLGRLTTPETIVTSDAGNFAGWLARGYRFRRPGTFLGPTSGAMGYGLPAAIAASLAYPRRQVVALAGDGGFAMTMNEIETAVREGVAPVALVLDNRRYGTIAMHQANEGRSHVATDLGPIDFAAAARAMGAGASSVSHDDQVADADLRGVLQRAALGRASRAGPRLGLGRSACHGAASRACPGSRRTRRPGREGAQARRGGRRARARSPRGAVGGYRATAGASSHSAGTTLH